MACPTCKREDVQDTCGSRLGEECKCCGLTIIATADDGGDSHEDHYHEGSEREDRNH